VLNSIQKKIEGTNDPKKIQEADFVIMAVQTPVTRLTDTGMDPVEPVSEDYLHD
jgi:UDP-N-acetyl-D-mannosaminuronate dehydrogenase